LALLPTLQGLGVPPEKIKEELIRMYELPKDFLEAIEQAPAPVASPSAADQAMVEGGVTEQVTSAEETARMLGSKP